MVTSFASVPRLWPNSTIVCLATGPSLCTDDIDVCRGHARLLAIKDAVRLAPDADALYACDAKWWRAHPETAGFDGPKYGLEAMPTRPDVATLRNTGMTGLEPDPRGLRTGKNSGFQAINLAVHFGARTIVLLGYDLQPDAQGQHHWFGAHSYNRNPPPYHAFLPLFATLLAPLAALGIRLINASRQTALACVPRLSLAEALA